EITSHHGDRINVSFPLSLLNTVHDLMPSDIREICGELNFQPKEFINEFNQMAGQDIVNIIQNEDQIRIWADPVDQSKTKKELGFLRVQVSEANHHRNFQVSVPRGFIQLAGKIVKNVGIVDRF